MKSNIVLIGMPGVGKSTVGVILAKRLGKNFIDTDIYLQQKTGKTLQQIIKEIGLWGFCELEEEYVAQLDVENHIIATGGSVVYGDAAMAHLKDIGTVIWLGLPYADLEKRVGDLDARGVVMEEGQTLRNLYDFRKPFYEKYADVKINTQGMTIDKVVSYIINCNATR